MQRSDYEEVSKIIEEVIGKDTITCVKLLQGIKFYFDKRDQSIELIRSEGNISNLNGSSIKSHKIAADAAMKRYTKKLNEDLKKESCSITG
tara:strand:+ start:58 stop:330 length:273 start_codon:yes stop_codon:yes gene_type:complete